MTSLTQDAQLYIDGAFGPAASGRTGPVHNKATGEGIGTYALGAKADVDRAVAAARAAQVGWAALAAPDRAALLVKLAAVLTDNYEDLLAQSMRETGGVRA